MQLTNEQEAAIAYRVRESLDQPHRWKQGDWGTDDEGEEIQFDGAMIATLYDKPHDDRCLCLAGAIRVACRAELGPGYECHPDVTEAMARHYVVIGDMTLNEDAEEELETGCGEPWLNAVIAWNDADGRTFSEVQYLALNVSEHLA